MRARGRPGPHPALPLVGRTLRATPFSPVGSPSPVCYLGTVLPASFMGQSTDIKGTGPVQVLRDSAVCVWGASPPPVVSTQRSTSPDLVCSICKTETTVTSSHCVGDGSWHNNRDSVESAAEYVLREGRAPAGGCALGRRREPWALGGGQGRAVAQLLRVAGSGSPPGPQPGRTLSAATTSRTRRSPCACVARPALHQAPATLTYGRPRGAASSGPLRSERRCSGSPGPPHVSSDTEAVGGTTSCRCVQSPRSVRGRR